MPRCRQAVEDMNDDPYRSLAGALRRRGGFAKDATPFSEFVWADFFRPRFKRRELAEDFDAKLERGVRGGEIQSRRLPARLVRAAGRSARAGRRAWQPAKPGKRRR